MGEKVDIAQIKKVLQDANLYEPNMPDETMISYYEAVNNSKNTAFEENDTRLNESQEKLLEIFEGKDDNRPVENKKIVFTPKTWVSTKITESNITEPNNHENMEDTSLEKSLDTPRDATQYAFGFNEMAKDSEQKIIHKLKYVPIQVTSNFLNAEITQKAKILYSYHTKANKIRTELARKSFYPAPLPKATSIIETFPNFSDDNFQETYISRSGRQTKRKVYNYDDEDSLDGVNHKKTKNSDEHEWLSKTTSNKTSARSKKNESNQSFSKSISPEMDADVSSTTSSATTTATPSTSTENSKLHTKTETKPTLKKLNNEEIMKRSRLFSDSPKKKMRTPI
ncbi:hypothetical protein NQ317_010672 [Molorchus minor]|uniref:Uncharacterized protein n=1 Tax=Molorchus minor TaxID=1323400 RepID=A0ABQ9K5P4_9CUCU|nr:hypothetical protein NQ317_010672 [Molorchus minor]